MLATLEWNAVFNPFDRSTACSSFYRESPTIEKHIIYLFLTFYLKRVGVIFDEAEHTQLILILILYISGRT